VVPGAAALFDLLDNDRLIAHRHGSPGLTLIPEQSAAAALRWRFRGSVGGRQ
jgi:hypothetical protein